MALASTDRVVLGSIAFSIFWVLAVFPTVPFLPVGRTAGSLLGGMLMVLFRVLTPDQAYAAIDLSILGLLFGTMVVSIYLERADMFKYLGILLSWKSKGPKDLLCRICIVSAISSAFFTNDTSCVVLTEFVLKIARKNNIPAHPFLLALASSANIGSAATPIGNPQNLVIAIQSNISFGKFLLGLLPAMLVGVLVNIVLLLCMYWKVLSVEVVKDEENALSDETVEEKNVTSHQPSSLAAPHTVSNDEVINIHISPNVNGTTRASDATESKPALQEELVPGKNFPEKPEEDVSKLDVDGHDLSDARQCKIRFGRKQKMLLWKGCVYLVTIGMLVALLVGLNMSWTALTAALALVVLDFKDARPSLDKVSYSLLVFFCGMFITVEGFNRTGLPSSFWNLTEPYARIDHVGGIAVLALVILVLSNVASNVPTVLLLGAKVAASAAAISPSEVKKSWLILAWVSTVAGNLSILGSAANLIVCEQARNSPVLSYNLSFWRHLKFGVPSTIIVITVGLALIR